MSASLSDSEPEHRAGRTPSQAGSLQVQVAKHWQSNDIFCIERYVADFRSGDGLGGFTIMTLLCC